MKYYTFVAVSPNFAYERNVLITQHLQKDELPPKYFSVPYDVNLFTPNVTASMVPHKLILITEATNIYGSSKFHAICLILKLLGISLMLPLSVSPPAERHVEASAQRRATFNTNPIKERHSDESGGERVAQCVSVEITLLCRT